ncbi:MAG: hypothetical protein J0L64_20440 [Acidobacteria bacterium]|nr:hypothetical protein [Acidobacteriota bacterium]
MKRTALLLALLPLMAHGAATERFTAGHLQFTLDGSERANFSYQLLCLAGKIPCSRAAYEQLWRKELGWTAEDDANLYEFGKLLELDTEERALRAPFPPNFPRLYDNMSREARLLAILLSARRPSRMERKFENTGATKVDAARIRALAATYHPRFLVWWRQEGRALCVQYPKELARVMREHRLDAYLLQMAYLLEPGQQFKRPVEMHVIARPAYAKSTSFATQISDQVLLEVSQGDRALQRVSLLVHETVHLFYAAASRKRHMALMQEFAGHRDEAAGSYYAYFNEALATAAGAVVDKRLMPGDHEREGPNWRYHHPFIPALARALVPLLEERLESNQPLLVGIAGPYIAAGGRELGPLARTLAFRFGFRVTTGERALVNSMRQVLLAAAPPTVSLYGMEPLDRFAHINVVRLEIHPGESPAQRLEARTAKSLELKLTAPDAASMEKWIRNIFAR